MELFDEIEPETEVDFVNTIAAPLPMIMIAQMLGVPKADRERFRVWSDSFIELMDEDEHASPELMDRVGLVQELPRVLPRRTHRARRQPAGRSARRARARALGG